MPKGILDRGGAYLQPDPVLGARLRAARKARRLTQQQACGALGISRPLLVAMERGVRGVTQRELENLAKLYERPVDELLRPTPPLEGLYAQLRAVLDEAGEVEQLHDLPRNLAGLVDDYLELARLAGVRLTHRYPPEVTVDGLPTLSAAEDVAAAERNRLGLGDGPVPHLREVLEHEVGLRIFVPAMPDRFAGLFVHSAPAGAFVALNGRHRPERRRWTLAHLYAYFLTSRSRAQVLLVDRYERTPAQEKFADAFAAHFLMPRNGVRRRFLELARARGTTEMPVADMYQLARVYGVTPLAMTTRMKNLVLTSPQTLERFQQAAEAAEEGYVAPPADDPRELLPLRYQMLAAELFAAGRITAEQLARFLRVDQARAVEIAAGLAPRIP